MNTRFFNKGIGIGILFFILFSLASCAFFKPHHPIVSEDNRFPLSTDTLLAFPPPPMEPKIDTTPPVDTALLNFTQFLKESGLVCVTDIDSSIAVDLRYATTDNFMHTNMYRTFKDAYLQYDVALRLKNAQQYLKEKHPHYRLVIYDAVRPLEVQKFMWDSVKIADAVKYKYLSNPKYHSLHNYGAAVDVGILDSAGKPLDMGTPYDCFCELAYPYYEKRFLANHKLSKTQYRNRLLLRRIMRKALFSPITTEWWHFNAHSRKYAKAHYPLIASFSQRPTSLLVASNTIPKTPPTIKTQVVRKNDIPPNISTPNLPKLQSDTVANIILTKRKETMAQQFNLPKESEQEHHIQFRVQIKLSKQQLSETDTVFKGLEISTYFHHGFFKYTTGHFSSLKDGLNARRKLQKMGFSDCFLVAFDNDKRIPIKDAISLLED